MYDGKNDNPHKNLYIYCLMSYIKDFYISRIPKIEVSSFPDVENINMQEDKTYFSLKDAAESYSQISNKNAENIRENMKKQFQKLEYMQGFKKRGRYEFQDIIFPIISYHYFRKNNHNCNSGDGRINSHKNIL